MSFSLLSTSHPKVLRHPLVRASSRLSATFTLLMDSSPGFGSCTSDNKRPIRTRFRFGSGCYCLSHATGNKVVGSLCKRHAVTVLRRLQLICTHHISESISSPLSGYFSPFPHGTIRYRSLHLFSLGWWSTRIRAGFHVSDLTQESSYVVLPFRLRGSHPLWPPVPGTFVYGKTVDIGGPTTPRASTRFGLFPVRSPLLGESLI